MYYNIKQIATEDWQQLKKIRLKALATDPASFGSNYKKESKMGEDDWQVWLTENHGAIFLLYEGHNPVGMTGIAFDRSDAERKTAILWGSWIKPSLRGKSLSRMLYEARINWAKAHPTIEKILVSHRESNLSSKKANQKHGFVYTHEYEKTWPDGVIEKDICYELRVKPAGLPGE